MSVSSLEQGGWQECERVHVADTQQILTAYLAISFGRLQVGQTRTDRTTSFSEQVRRRQSAGRLRLGPGSSLRRPNQAVRVSGPPARGQQGPRELRRACIRHRTGRATLGVGVPLGGFWPYRHRCLALARAFVISSQRSALVPTAVPFAGLLHLHRWLPGIPLHLPLAAAYSRVPRVVGPRVVVEMKLVAVQQRAQPGVLRRVTPRAKHASRHGSHAG
jgi:hypothetical protein